jgi:hypothetical protein
MPATPAGLPRVQAKDHRDQIVHTLGKVTLLTRELSSSVSKGPLGKKLAQIAGLSLLRLNKEIEAHDRCFRDEAAIHALGKALAALACRT